MFIKTLSHPSFPEMKACVMLCYVMYYVNKQKKSSKSNQTNYSRFTITTRLYSVVVVVVVKPCFKYELFSDPVVNVTHVKFLAVLCYVR